MSGAGMRIGEAAALLGVSTRTLRYYQELELVVPSAFTAGGARRYRPADVERCRRVRELQVLLGFDLDEIRQVLDAEDRLQALREEWQSGQPPKARRRQILQEGMDLNQSLQRQVREKQRRLQAFLDELEERAERVRLLAADLQVPAPA